MRNSLFNKPLMFLLALCTATGRSEDRTLPSGKADRTAQGNQFEVAKQKDLESKLAQLKGQIAQADRVIREKQGEIEAKGREIIEHKKAIELVRRQIADLKAVHGVYMIPEVLVAALPNDVFPSVAPDKSLKYEGADQERAAAHKKTEAANKWLETNIVGKRLELEGEGKNTVFGKDGPERIDIILRRFHRSKDGGQLLAKPKKEGASVDDIGIRVPIWTLAWGVVKREGQEWDVLLLWNGAPSTIRDKAIVQKLDAAKEPLLLRASIARAFFVQNFELVETREELGRPTLVIALGKVEP